MRQGARIYHIPTPDQHHTRQFRILYQPPGSFEVHVHNNCLCNEYISLRNRVLMEVPSPTHEFVRPARELAHRIGTWLGRHTPMEGEWISKYSGRKLTLYRQAEASLLIDGFHQRDRYIKSFIKPEKISDPTRDPRTIQARSPRYNYCLGNYLKPIEHKLYRITGSRNLRRWLPRGRLIAKGLDLRARAYLVRSKLNSLPNCVCLSIDASRFDAHVGRVMLDIEHSVYKRCYPGDRLLQKLLDLQQVNRGFTAGGIAYKCPGGRMSGDMNTALGNCLLMVIITAVTMRRLGLAPSQWQMLCDGDDTLIFVSAEHEQLLTINFPELFNQAGMSIKLENRASKLEQIAFCQGKIIPTYDGLKFVQNPIRSMSRSLVSCRHYQHLSAVNKVLATVGRCELAINMGVPVLQAYAQSMIRNAGEVPPRHAVNFSGRVFKAQREWRAHGGVVEPLPITMEARLAFEEAFDMPLDEQLRLERLFATVVY